MAEVGEVKYRVELDDSDVGRQADKTNETLISKFGGGAKKVGAAVLGASAAVATAATAAVASLTHQAVDAFAEFQQLEGGVQTLFGSAYDSIEEFAEATKIPLDEAGHAWEEYQAREQRVLDNANNAYKTAGMSANEYMEMVTGFAASLNSSLGEHAWQSANVADMAIQDMADNANKMGTDIEAVQNAYAGFAKGNFAMLDNLKLGFGGTGEQMDKLLRKAEELEGYKPGSLSKDSFADIIEGIHIIQENLGITGTTAEEASKTIAGSFAMVEASWQNVVTAIGEGDDNKLTEVINNLVDSVGIAANNLLPVVEDALNGIAQLVEELAPVIAEKLPAMITDALPGLLDAGVQTIEALAEGIVTAIPQLMPTIIDVVMQLANMIIKLAPDIIKCGIEIIVQLALGIADAIPELIPVMIDALLMIEETLIDNVDMLIDAAIAIIVALVEGIMNALPRLIEKAPEIIYKLTVALIKNAPKLIEAATKIVFTIIEGIVNLFGKIIETGADIVEKVKNGFSSKVQDAKNWGRDVINNFIDGIKEKWEHLKQTVANVAQTVKDLLGFSEPKEGPLHDFHTYAPDMMRLYAKGIRDNMGLVEDSVWDVSKNVAETFSASIEYELPDIAGYASDLSAMVTSSMSNEIIVPLNIDGREVARATAVFTNEQLAWESR